MLGLTSRVARVAFWMALPCLAGCRRCTDFVASSTGNVIPVDVNLAPPRDPVPTATASVSVCGAPAVPFPEGPRVAFAGGEKAMSRTTRWAPGIPGGVPNRTQICKTLAPCGGADCRPMMTPQVMRRR